MNLTLAITTYNRIEFLRESFEQVIDHPRITEILLMDDCSDRGIFRQIEALKELSPKIKVCRQARNRGMGYNKYSAVVNSTNEWVILFDSDNVITHKYIDSIPENLSYTCIYHPEFAKPNFDFRAFTTREVIGGYPLYLNKFSIKNVSHLPMLWTMLNACNYVVNRNEYVKVYEENTEHKGSDSIWFAYLWLKSPNSILVVPGMEYEHRVHPGSGFLKDADYNMRKAEEVKKLILCL